QHCRERKEEACGSAAAGQAVHGEAPGKALRLGQARRAHPYTELANVDTAIILAIDLGKFKSVACVYRRGGGAAAFHTIASTRAALLGLLDAVAPAVVVIEACALAGWACDLCGERGLACKVANTAAEAWRFKSLKRKADRDDALRLAQLEALGQLPTV